MQHPLITPLNLNQLGGESMGARMAMRRQESARRREQQSPRGLSPRGQAETPAARGQGETAPAERGQGEITPAARGQGETTPAHARVPERVAVLPGGAALLPPAYGGEHVKLRPREVAPKQQTYHVTRPTT